MQQFIWGILHRLCRDEYFPQATQTTHNKYHTYLITSDRNIGRHNLHIRIIVVKAVVAVAVTRTAVAGGGCLDVRVGNLGDSHHFADQTHFHGLVMCREGRRRNESY